MRHAVLANDERRESTARREAEDDRHDIGNAPHSPEGPGLLTRSARRHEAALRLAPLRLEHRAAHSTEVGGYHGAKRVHHARHDSARHSLQLIFQPLRAAGLGFC